MTVFRFTSLFIGFFYLVLVKNLCNGAKPVLLLNCSFYLPRITGLLLAVAQRLSHQSILAKFTEIFERKNQQAFSRATNYFYD